MGNQPSSGSGGGGVGNSSSGGGNANHHHRPSNTGAGPIGFTTGNGIPTLAATFRLPQFSTGALKLSRAELDKRCQPSGLYPTTPWEPRTVRRLIGDGKLAARLKGTDERGRSTDQECPICFLHYAQVNVTRCCHAAVCTECYLQVRPQKERNTAPCPFCNAPKVSVRVAKLLTGSQVKQREAEEQRVIAAQIEARKTGLTGESAQHSSNEGSSSNRNNTRSSTTFGLASNFGGGDSTSSGGSAPSTPQPYRSEQTMQSMGGGVPTAPNTPGTPPPRPGEFGAALNRYRAESFASSEGHASSDAGDSLTLTPTQRSQIHAQLRSQSDHPLARQMEEEARRRREDNEMEYYRAHSGRLLERYEEYQRRAQRSRALADRMLLQAHGIPTRGEAGFAARGGGGGPGPTTILAPRNDGGNGGLESAVIEAALMMSMEEEAERQRRGEAAGSGAEGGGGEANENESENATGENPQPPSLAALLSLSSGASGSRRRLVRARNGRGPSSAHMLGTAGMLMQGISEEDQVAMAIALSLRDAENAQDSGSNDDDDGEAGDGGGGPAGGNEDDDNGNTSGNTSETEEAQNAAGEDHGTDEDGENRT